MPNARRFPALLLGLAIITGGCAAAPPPSASPSPSPSDGPSAAASEVVGDIDHPTGANEVVLRYEEGGGMMLDWSLAQSPIFTLYGDGTAVFRNLTDVPPPDGSGRLVYPPLQTARLGAEQMAELLAFAVAEGGLAAARDRYEHPMIADAGTAIFTLNAGGRTKEVSVYALAEGDTTAPDQASRSQFFQLAERLRTFGTDDTLTVSPYIPKVYRVFLIEGPGQPAKVNPWPWPELTPADFAAPAGDQTAPAFPHRVMSVDEVAALGVDGVEGGMMGHYVKGPSGGLYNVIVRPLLPDEER